MDEQQIRLLVRHAIARHLGGTPAAAPAVPPPGLRLPAVAAPPPLVQAESSIATRQFVIIRPEGETDCIIEPSVACNHCGHCLCYGH